MRGVLDVVSKDLGFKQPVVTANDVGDDKFVAFVELIKLVPTGESHLDNYTAQGEVKNTHCEAINSAVWNALHFFVTSHRVGIVDPSSMVLHDLNVSIKGIIDELVFLHDHAEAVYNVAKKACDNVKDMYCGFDQFVDDCNQHEDSIKSILTDLDNYCARVRGIVDEMGVCVTEALDMYVFEGVVEYHG